MNEVLEIGAKVSTPLGLIGLIATLFFFFYHRRLRNQEKTLQALPESQRLQFVDEFLTRYKLDIGNLTREQKFSLVCQEMEKKEAFSKLVVIVSAVVFVLCFFLAAIAYGLILGKPQPKPPSGFSMEFRPTEEWTFEGLARRVAAADGCHIEFTKCDDRLKAAKIRTDPMVTKPQSHKAFLEDLRLRFRDPAVQRYKVKYHEERKIYEIIGE